MELLVLDTVERALCSAGAPSAGWATTSGGGTPRSGSTSMSPTRPRGRGWPEEPYGPEVDAVDHGPGSRRGAEPAPHAAPGGRHPGPRPRPGARGAPAPRLGPGAAEEAEAAASHECLDRWRHAGARCAGCGGPVVEPTEPAYLAGPDDLGHLRCGDVRLHR